MPPPTDAELIAQLEALPPNVKGEIIDGELFVQPRPRFRHARASSFLVRHIGGAFDFDDEGPGGWWILIEPGIELPGAPEVAPDLGGWGHAAMPEPPAEGLPIRVVPSWVCEVLSPSNQRWDVLEKVTTPGDGRSHHAGPLTRRVDPAVDSRPCVVSSPCSWPPASSRSEPSPPRPSSSRSTAA